jgi:hypothetical protein
MFWFILAKLCFGLSLQNSTFCLSLQNFALVFFLQNAALFTHEKFTYYILAKICFDFFLEFRFGLSLAEFHVNLFWKSPFSLLLKTCFSALFKISFYHPYKVVSFFLKN